MKLRDWSVNECDDDFVAETDSFESHGDYSLVEDGNESSDGGQSDTGDDVDDPLPQG